MSGEKALKKDSSNHPPRWTTMRKMTCLCWKIPKMEKEEENMANRFDRRLLNQFIAPGQSLPLALNARVAHWGFLVTRPIRPTMRPHDDEMIVWWCDYIRHHYLRSKSSIFPFLTKASRTDGPTDGPTDRPTDGRTDPHTEMRGRI